MRIFNCSITFAAAIAAAVLALPVLGAGEAASTGNFAYAASHPETPRQTDGNSSATAADDSSSGFHITPTLKGGATASISGIDPNLGFAFAIDGYYTPYGDDMTGGGFSMLIEGAHFGFRCTGVIASGNKDGVEMDMTYLAWDLYLRQALAANLYAYAGVGVAGIQFDTEYTYHTGFYHGHHQWREYDKTVETHGDSDPLFTCYAGLRWRFLDPIYLFAEYRYDADAKIDVGGDEETELEGGGRFLFGGGFMF